MKTLLRLGLLLCTAVVVGGSFLEWGTFDVDQSQLRDVMSQIPFMNIVEEHVGEDIFVTGIVTVVVTGWEGSVTVANVDVPNWVVAACALAWTLLGWIGASGRRRALLVLALVTALYPLVHLGILVWALHAEGEILLGVVAALLGSVSATTLLITGLARRGAS